MRGPGPEIPDRRSAPSGMTRGVGRFGPARPGRFGRAASIGFEPSIPVPRSRSGHSGAPQGEPGISPMLRLRAEGRTRSGDSGSSLRAVRNDQGWVGSGRRGRVGSGERPPMDSSPRSRSPDPVLVIPGHRKVNPESPRRSGRGRMAEPGPEIPDSRSAPSGMTRGGSVRAGAAGSVRASGLQWIRALDPGPPIPFWSFRGTARRTRNLPDAPVAGGWQNPVRRFRILASRRPE